MGKYKLSKDRIFIYICFLYLVGTTFGVFLFRKNDFEIVFTNKSFISLFLQNFWYLFLMWIFGLSVCGLLINSFIIFFRGFLLGGIIAILIRHNLKEFAVMLSLEIILFLPAFFTLSYFSLAIAYQQLFNMFRPSPMRINNKTYLNIMLIVTIVIIIYSLIITIYH